MQYEVSYSLNRWADRIPMDEKELRKFLRRYGFRFKRKGGREEDEYTSDHLDNGHEFIIEWHPLI